MFHHLQSSELHCRPRALQFCIGCYTRLCSFQNTAEASASCRMRFFLVCGGGTKFFPQRRKNTCRVILQMFPWGFLHPQDIPESMGTCVCLCVYVHVEGEEKEKRTGHWVKDMIASLFQLILTSFIGMTQEKIKGWDESLFLEAARTTWFMLEYQQGLLHQLPWPWPH